LKKKATYVDHYAVLGLEKGTPGHEITAAYKRLVREWHPDRHRQAAKKKEAETMMKKINIAYDVLGDNDKRGMYDAGRDPDDPMGGANQGFGFNPFDMFFNSAGGGTASRPGLSEPVISAPRRRKRSRHPRELQAARASPCPALPGNAGSTFERMICRTVWQRLRWAGASLRATARRMTCADLGSRNCGAASPQGSGVVMRGAPRRLPVVWRCAQPAG